MSLQASMRNSLPKSPSELRAQLATRITALRAYVNSKIPSRLRRVVSADDILQEVWLSANRGADSCTPDTSSAVDGWLITIANRKLIDAIRAAYSLKRGGDRRFVCDAEARLTSLCGIFTKLRSRRRTPSHEVGRVEAAHAVGIALATLGDERRRAIEMRYVEELPRQEIAKRMGRSEAAVNSLIFNGLRKLRDTLGEVSRYLSA